MSMTETPASSASVPEITASQATATETVSAENAPPKPLPQEASLHEASDQEVAPEEHAAVQAPDPESTVASKPSPRARQRVDAMPVLERLAGLYPQLFGALFLPLKRGIFQDLLAAHPDAFDSAGLKAALSHHTRSTRYLVTVAEGRQRHDLQAQAVEAMAPEHVHQALVEVFRRRQARTREDLSPTLRRRIAQAFARSGLSPEAYATLVHSRDEQINAWVHEALQEARAATAKDEALLRAFETSGQAVDGFAEMYGMDARTAGAALERARRARTGSALADAPA